MPSQSYNVCVYSGPNPLYKATTVGFDLKGIEIYKWGLIYMDSAKLTCA